MQDIILRNVEFHLKSNRIDSLHNSKFETILGGLVLFPVGHVIQVKTKTRRNS